MKKSNSILAVTRIQRILSDLSPETQRSVLEFVIRVAEEDQVERTTKASDDPRQMALPS